MKGVLNFFRKIKNITIGIFFLSFLLSILANFTSPYTSRFIPVFGLVFIPLFIFNGFILLINYKRNKLISLISIIMMIGSFQFVLRSFQVHFDSEQKGVKVLSWNVKNFDLYNWTKNLETKQKMFHLLKDSHADILCFQEFFTDDFKHDNIQSLKKIGYPYYSFIPTYSQSNTGNKWGLAIFSKTPLTYPKLIYINPNKESINQCLRAQTKINGKPYTIYNAHFQSIHLNYSDYDYINDLKHQWDMVDLMKSKNIATKLIEAYKKRTDQVETMLKALREDPSEKKIICCDLNDVPNSFAYHELSKSYRDTYREKGRWISNTTNFILPLFRIDYVFTNENVKINSFRRVKTNLSDHHLLITYLE